MIPVYCINLASRPDRWAYIEGLARTSGFDLTRVDAVDAQDERHGDALSAMISKGPTGIVGRGALACTLSHTKAWETFLQSDAEAAVFLEDDVILSDDFVAVISEIGHVTPQFDLIKLECGGSMSDGVLLGAPVAQMGSRALHPCYQMATDAAGYILTRAGAKQALARISKCDVGVDHFLFYPRARRGGAGLGFGIVAPAVVIQDRSIGSNISKSRYEDSKWRRMLRRSYYEIAPVPFMIWKLLKGARIKRVPFQK